MYRDRLRASPVFLFARDVTRKFISPVLSTPRGTGPSFFDAPLKALSVSSELLSRLLRSERLRIGTRQREENVASLPLINGPGINPDGGPTSLEEVMISFMKRLLLNAGVFNSTRGSKCIYVSSGMRGTFSFYEISRSGGISF